MMFEFDRRLCVILLLIGFVVGFVLWAFRLVPWWGVLIAAPVVPLVLVTVIWLLMVVAWMSSGSH